MFVLFVARRRIVEPLRSLESLISRLADGSFEPVPVEGIEPVLLPLFANYNHLVSRLRRLEEEHASRAESLEEEVRVATKALLQQQQSLARAHRLAATGELAASVAHELRNPLAAIQMALRNLRQDLSEADLIERVDLVQAEIDRLGRLLTDLLGVSRHSAEPSRSVRIDQVVGELLDLTRYQLPETIALERDISDDLVCRLPEDSFRQALLNLVLNAADALPDGRGTVSVSAGLEGSELVVAVEDDGPGFENSVLAEEGRPFVSTRERGTGLGLAIVHRFASELGGKVQLANRVPHGARVTLRLPHRIDHD